MGQGLGKALLKDALLRSEQAAKEIGVRAVIVDAIDEEATTFYRHFDFEPFVDDPNRLMLLMKDLRRRRRAG